jgi:pyrimidine operon attenuation protein / uracil phosphoribosyltransferase
VKGPLTRSREARKDQTDVEKIVLDAEDVRRTLARISHEIVERTGGRDLALVGVHRRGAVLARRLRGRLEQLCKEPPPLGDVDISFYRDDVGLRSPSRQPVVHASHVDFPLERRTIVLVDDVLYTGRTARAAIDALFDYGRPARVQLAVLADRGHRELPIRPDYVGKNLPTACDERVNVRVVELDGADEVTISEPSDGAPGDGRALEASATTLGGRP